MELKSVYLNKLLLLFLTFLALCGIFNPGTFARTTTLSCAWKPPTVGSPVKNYRIYCSVNDSDYREIGISSDTTYSFTAVYGNTYRVKVSAVDSTGIEGPLSEASKDTTLSGVDDKQDENIPKTFSLGQNFPNPFNSATVIRYQLPAVSGQQSADGGRRSAVTIRIYNSLGERVRNLVDEKKEPGCYMVPWNGEDNWGRKVSSGVYFYRLEVMVDGLKAIKTKRMIFLK